MFIIGFVWCVIVAPAISFVGLLFMFHYNCATMTNFMIMAVVIASVPIWIRLYFDHKKRQRKASVARRRKKVAAEKAQKFKRYMSMPIAELCNTPGSFFDQALTTALGRRHAEVQPYAIEHDKWALIR